MSLIRSYLLFCSLFVLATAIVAPVSAQEDESRKAFEAIRKAHGLPGLMGGIFSISGPTQVYAVGVRRIEHTEPLQVSDAMHLGSCTKSMTATQIGLLVDEGLLHWDSTLGDIFGEPIRSTDWSNITIDQLLHHTSGVIENAPWQKLQKENVDVVKLRAGLIDWLAKKKRDASRTGQFHYSNTGYTILGHVIEVKRGVSWEDDIRTRLFEPLGMKSAGFGPPSFATNESTAWGHEKPLLGKVFSLAEDNPPIMGPAGRVHASLEDWAKYLKIHVTEDPADFGNLIPISNKTLLHLHTPSEGERYAGGWLVEKRDWAGGRVLFHNGSNTMWYCMVFLAPEQKRGVFAASNIGLSSAKGADEVLQRVIQAHPYAAPADKPR